MVRLPAGSRGPRTRSATRGTGYRGWSRSLPRLWFRGSHVNGCHALARRPAGPPTPSTRRWRGLACCPTGRP
eukprot:9416492-Pyramimonas_sp.AAC.1